MDNDILEALKLAGIHVARTGMRGEFVQVFNYADSVVPESDLIGKQSIDILPHCPHAKKFTESRIQVAQSGTSLVGDMGTPLFNKPGFSHAKTIMVPRIQDGKVVGTTSLLIDISDKSRELEEANKKLEKANKQLSERNKQLEKATRAKEDFLSMMSHEIRNPLNSMFCALQLIESKTELTAEQQENHDIIYQSGDNLLRIVNGVLDYSRLETNQITFIPRDFDIYELVHQAVALVKSQQVKGCHAQFIVDMDDSVSHSCRADDVRIFQVLCNLLHNAAKYTHDGSITTRIMHIAVVAEGMSLKFIVEDTGEGIPPQFIKHLFEPFSQAHADKARLLGGTGLGLAISKKLVEGMKGQLGVESVEGKGSKFWFKVPCESAAEPIKRNYSSSSLLEFNPRPENQSEVCVRLQNKPEEPTVQPAIVQGSAAVSVSPTIIVNIPSIMVMATTSGTTPCVLVAEDNLVNQKMLVKLLQRLGVCADTAENGEEAFKLFNVNPTKYKAVLTDLMMPIRNGVELCEDIRQKAKSDIPVIAITADVVVGRETECLSKGFSEYLAKPVMVDKLKAVLQKWKVI